MTPDMKRLYEAAEKEMSELACVSAAGDGYHIVRAVLMELRNLDKLSDDVLDEIDEAAVAGAAQSVNSRLLRMAKVGRKGPVGLAPAEWLGPSLEALIDGILEIKARRAEALTELAQNDADLI